MLSLKSQVGHAMAATVFVHPEAGHGGADGIFDSVWVVVEVVKCEVSHTHGERNSLCLFWMQGTFWRNKIKPPYGEPEVFFFNPAL